jgi:uncharacterized membrane protein
MLGLAFILLVVALLVAGPLLLLWSLNVIPLKRGLPLLCCSAHWARKRRTSYGSIVRSRREVHRQ